MSLKDSVNNIKGLQDGLTSNKVANFSYTDTAYTENTVDGVPTYNENAEQNIPVGTPSVLNINPTVLARGYRARSSSITRMFLNHFFGRVSYNLNKVNDNLKSLLVALQTNLGEDVNFATLDASGKVPFDQLPESSMVYQGSWDASTNTPALSNGMTGASAGYFYVVSKAGSHNFGDGVITFLANDRVIYNKQGKWDKLSGGSVQSINGVNPDASTGNVTITKSDVGLGSVANTGDSATPAKDGTKKFTTGGAYTELAKKQDKVTKLGTTSKPIYIATDGTFDACKDYGGGTAITLNGTAQGGQLVTIYAPTVGGGLESGGVLKCNGDNREPTWDFDIPKDLGTAKNDISGLRTELNDKQSKVPKLGSTSQPVYTNAEGIFEECSNYAGGTAVTLNGVSKASDSASFYAPTSAGTSGQILQNVKGTLTWIDASFAYSGICETAMNNATKEVVIRGFTSVEGMKITVLFKNGNSEELPKLAIRNPLTNVTTTYNIKVVHGGIKCLLGSVESTTSVKALKSGKWRGATRATNEMWQPNTILELIYDGTDLVIMGNPEVENYSDANGGYSVKADGLIEIFTSETLHADTTKTTTTITYAIPFVHPPVVTHSMHGSYTNTYILTTTSVTIAHAGLNFESVLQAHLIGY